MLCSSGFQHSMIIRLKGISQIALSEVSVKKKCDNLYQFCEENPGWGQIPNADGFVPKLLCFLPEMSVNSENAVLLLKKKPLKIYRLEILLHIIFWVFTLWMLNQYFVLESVEVKETNWGSSGSTYLRLPPVLLSGYWPVGKDDLGVWEYWPDHPGIFEGHISPQRYDLYGCPWDTLLAA